MKHCLQLVYSQSDKSVVMNLGAQQHSLVHKASIHKVHTSMRNAFLLCFCLVVSLSMVHGALVDEAIIAPSIEQEYMSASVENDPFANCPSYGLQSARQVLLAGDKSAEWNEDYQANVRMAWDSEALYVRLDVVDDSRVTAPPSEGTSSDGDSFTLCYLYRTVGPNRRATLPWYVHLYPDFENNTVRVIAEAQDKVTAARLGQPEAIMFKQQINYSIVARIPFGGWEDAPKAGTFMRLQILFADDDDANTPGINHLFSYFPTDSGRVEAARDLAGFGQLNFVNKVWLDLRADGALFSEGQFHGRLRYGNLTSEARQASIEVLPFNRDPAQTGLEPVISTIPSVDMPPNSKRDEILVTLPMQELAAKTVVRLRAVSGVYNAPTVVVVHSVNNMVYLPLKIERQKQQSARDLLVYQSRTGLLDTMRYMAGGGTVIWNVGRYDASSAEFPEFLREKAEYTISLPEAKPNVVPWALLGGRDRLDGMAEPLHMKMLPEIFTQHEKFSPPLPEFDYLSNDRRHQRKAVRSTRLLLIGFVYDYIDDESMPEIVISAGHRRLLREKLIGTPVGGVGKRHSYVLRVWLEEATEYSQLSVTNVAPFGPRAEIDFMALIAGGPPAIYATGDAAIRFGGSPEAEIFTRQLATSKFFLRNYFISRTGDCYESLPGGRGGMAHLDDYGLFMEELAAWGALDAARELGVNITTHMNTLRERYLRQGEVTLGYPSLLIGLHALRRKSPTYNVARGWLSVVHRPVTDMIETMNRHPLGLIDVTDPRYTEQVRPGATLTMAVATEAALRAAADMAGALGWRQSVTSWKREADRIPDRIDSLLTAPAGGMRLVVDEPVPGGFGLAPQETIYDELPAQAWLYGRYTDRRPIIHTGGRRVFDTPYVLSPLPYYVSLKGFSLDERTRVSLSTTLNYLYIASPLFQGTTRPTFLTHGILEYDTSDIQLLTVMAALLADNSAIATKLLNAYIRYNFDEYAPLPDEPGRRADAEISPYTFQQKLNVSPEGENLGASMDDLNLMTGVLALRTARLVAGVDDRDDQQLKLLPRLPEEWGNIAVDNWLVSHNFAGGGVHPITYTYRRMENNQYTMSFKSDRPVEQLQMRFGPFPRGVRRVLLSGSGMQERIAATDEGAHAWAYKTLRNVSEVNLSCRPVN